MVVPRGRWARRLVVYSPGIRSSGLIKVHIEHGDGQELMSETISRPPSWKRGMTGFVCYEAESGSG